jgi:hypothetical protein
MCTCTRADAAVLTKYCSIKGHVWPEKNEELVNECFDLLLNRSNDFLQELQHNPGQNISCTKQLLMHTYWSGPMTWKLKAVIQSFLFTHYTNDTSCRPKPVLNVWLQDVNPNGYAAAEHTTCNCMRRQQSDFARLYHNDDHTF